MASSPILGINLVGPTQNDKTTPINDAIVALEAAGNDQLPVNMAAGNVTLSATQFTRFQIFVCSGLTADRTLTIPLTKRLFAVRNATSHVVTVGPPTGASVTIAANNGAIIQCDGVNCVLFGSGGVGPAGATGAAGGAVNINYTFVAAITNADPGAGGVALNNATQNTATAIFTDLMDADGNDWTAVLDTLDASTNTVKGQIRLFARATPTAWILFDLMARVTHAGYRELTVVPVASSTANPFSATEALSFSYSRSGDAGVAGPPGPNVWRTGIGPPTANPGVDGDLWLNTTNSDVWQRAAGVYAIVANIKGLQGVIGAVWRAVAGVPDNAVGIDGDYAINTLTSDVYVRSAGAYAIALNIRGPAGAVWREGIAAPLNTVGSDGDFWLQGATGDVWQRAAGVYAVVCNIKGPPGGVTTLDGLIDVNTGGVVSGDALIFDGTNWVPGTIAAGITTLDGLTDVNTGGAIIGDILFFNGTNWVPGTIAAGITAFGELSGAATFAQLPAEAANLPIGFSHPGTMTDAEVLLIIPVNQTLTIPSGLPGTYLGTDGTLPSASTVIMYDHFTSSAWVNRGTLTINTGGTLAITGAPTADITVVPGEALRFVGQAVADAAFADFGLVTMLRRV